MNAALKYLNAINILAKAKIDALQKIYDCFGDDWEKAWHSNLTAFLPKVHDSYGKLIPADYERIKKMIDPDKEWQKLLREGVEILTILDTNYPELLRHIPHPPFMLYIKGSHGVWRNTCFAVVGTRRLSEYGKRGTLHITQGLVRAGFIIVSGLADGIDALAHKMALQEGSKTIAVLGCGIDDKTIFPQQNLGLAHKIIETGGALISEYAVGTHGTKFTFPQRNRIISGLSRGVMIVEADEISGALITAHCAIDQNRDLFIVPGNIFSRTSQGTNKLIKKGAKAVTCAEDVLEEYDIYLKDEKPRIRADNEIEAKILTVLNSEPMTPDDIIKKTGLAAPQVNATLMIMELGKKIKNLGGGKFVLYE